MKKTVLGIIILFAVTLLTPIKTFAAGGFSVSTEEINLHPGDTASFTVTATNSVGKIDLLSSDANIASIDTDSIFLDQDSAEITVTATGVGSTSISVTATANFATYDEEILEGQSYQISVNVTETPQPSDDPENNETITDQDNQDDQNDQNNQGDSVKNTVANTPDTGSNSQSGGGATQIIISSIVGVSLITALFVAFFLHKRAKARQ
ncbi:hypothetical protein IKE98_00600 [Candidatus Saccharibacteria bacterium]|nr:hypothetical protein [Candidatus Saccharibacteria bacterium]